MNYREKVDKKIHQCMQEKDMNVRYTCVRDVADKLIFLEVKATSFYSVIRLIRYLNIYLFKL